MSSICPTMPGDRLYTLAVSAVQRLQAAGFIAYLAGGCVRDLLLNIQPNDYDIATSALPSQVESLFPGSGTSGKSFAVTRVNLDGYYMEIATFRKDHAYIDGRRPEQISFSDPETDAQRRDLTINAIFLDPVTGIYHDFVNGQQDLNARIIRCVGDPETRFAEDHLRMMRAVRFAGTLDFSIHPDTADAIRKNAEKISKISAERIHDELTRILLESKRPGSSIALLDKLNLLKIILPEVAAMKGQCQPPEFHPEGDVFTHTINMLDMMNTRSAQLVYAVLFHDIGKPPTATSAPDRIRFNNHAREGARMAEDIMRRLRFSADDVLAISHCVKNHMRFMDVQNMRRSTLRRLIGAPTFQVEIELHRLDCESSHRDLSNWTFLADFMRKLSLEPVLPKPWITGHDIMQMGLPESRQIGLLRTMAYDAQLEGRFKDRNELAEWLQKEINKQK